MKFTIKERNVVPTAIFVIMILISCKSAKEPIAAANQNKNKTFMNPPLIIYKTRKDYFNKVPVDLSADKKSVVSYPSPTDIYYKGELATPTRLADGWLLDNRGIGINSAFLKLTYSKYAMLAETPSPEFLFNQILDNDPISEMYSCKCSRDTAELNLLIKNNFTEKCFKLK